MPSEWGNNCCLKTSDSLLRFYNGENKLLFEENILLIIKGNNKITEHQAIFQKAKLIRQQTDKISQQPENWENRNGPDLVQAFLKKWWVE